MLICKLFFANEKFFDIHIGKQLSKRGLDDKEYFTILAIHFLFWSISPMPFVFTFVIQWREPCEASYVGYWILKECSSPSSSGNIFLIFIHGFIKIILAMLNFVMLSFTTHMTFFIVCGVAVSTLCFRSSLKIYQVLYLDYVNATTMPKIAKSLYCATIFYRKTQLLNASFNHIHQKIISSTGILGITIIQICSWNLLIKSEWNVVNLPLISVFLLSACNATITNLTVIAVMGSLVTISIKILHLVKWKRSRFGRNLWVRRFHLSCVPLKIKFGDSNYYDQLTPLNIQNFAITQTVNLLLVK